MPVAMPNYNAPDDEIKRWLNCIAAICLSEDFKVLKQELEKQYNKSNIDNVRLVAFQDALFAFLAQNDDEFGQHSLGC